MGLSRGKIFEANGIQTTRDLDFSPASNRRHDVVFSKRFPLQWSGGRGRKWEREQGWFEKKMNSIEQGVLTALVTFKKQTE